MRFHAHEFLELTLVTDGMGTYEILRGGAIERIAVRPHSILLWRGDTPHRSIDAEGHLLQQLILLFDWEYLRCLRAEPYVRNLLTAHDPVSLQNPGVGSHLAPKFFEILREEHSRELGRDDLLRSLLYALLIRVLRHFENGSDARTWAVTDDRIRRAVEYGQLHYYRTVSLEEIAKIACLSQRRFTELFRQETGLSWNRFAHVLRVQAAKRILLSSSYSVTDTAQMVGYTDAAYFCRWFKEISRITPSEYLQWASRRLDVSDKSVPSAKPAMLKAG